MLKSCLTTARSLQQMQLPRSICCCEETPAQDMWNAHPKIDPTSGKLQLGLASRALRAPSTKSQNELCRTEPKYKSTALRAISATVEIMYYTGYMPLLPLLLQQLWAYNVAVIIATIRFVTIAAVSATANKSYGNDNHHAHACHCSVFHPHPTAGAVPIVTNIIMVPYSLSVAIVSDTSNILQHGLHITRTPHATPNGRVDLFQAKKLFLP